MCAMESITTVIYPKLSMKDAGVMGPDGAAVFSMTEREMWCTGASGWMTGS